MESLQKSNPVQNFVTKYNKEENYLLWFFVNTYVVIQIKEIEAKQQTSQVKLENLFPKREFSLPMLLPDP